VWVLDARGALCPPGVSGEIHIGGTGVTQGYLHRPELTADRFVPDHLVSAGSVADARLYRTGDRGRWRIDGVLEHQGRLDFQVKVRGHRIELGEIEHVLARQDGVSRAVTIVREDAPGDVRLVAYVVMDTDGATDEQRLLSALRDALPRYMVPQHVVRLPAIPLLPNGKLDRGRLPAPVGAPSVQEKQGDARRFDDPRQAYLAGVWSDMLGVPVEAGDNFFEMGGHSMLAVQMANRVARDTGVRLRVLELATQTLAQAADQLPSQGTPEDGSGAGDAAPAGLLRRMARWFRRGEAHRAG
jgi:hypothetical protein